MTTDVREVFSRDAPAQWGADGELKKGRNNEVSALFHVSWQAVTGRLASFSVAPDFVVRSVTPPPE